jgi:hypothetical protein
MAALKEIPLDELIEKLKRFDEITLLELLNITTEDLVDRFEDYVESKYETLVEEVADEEL